MFPWITSLFFKPKQEIFRFWDGQKWRGVDPLVAWRRMWEDPDCKPNEDFPGAVGRGSKGEEVNIDYQAQDRVVAMARRMFDVQEWRDGAGLTVSQTLNLLWVFIEYMNALKKKRSRLPMQSAPSESASTPDSTTPHELASSSINPESKSDEPRPSSKRSLQF